MSASVTFAQTNAVTISIEQVVQQHGAAISRLVQAFERDPALRDDLTQEILLAIWQALAAFRGEASLRTFVLRIAHHRAVSHVLREKKRGKFSEIDDSHIDTQADPARSASQQQQSQRLLAAVQALPLADKELVTLALEGLTHREIAELMGLNENHVAVKLSRARARLQQTLDLH